MREQENYDDTRHELDLNAELWDEYYRNYDKCLVQIRNRRKPHCREHGDHTIQAWILKMRRLVYLMPMLHEDFRKEFLLDVK